MTEKKNFYSLGIDIGSTTVKVVVLDEANKLLFRSYERHFSKTRERACETLRSVADLLKEQDIRLTITGSAGLGVANAAGIDFVQEVYATAAAVNTFIPDTDAVIADECQFFTAEQIDGLRKIVDLLDVPVLCYGLRTDFLTKLFPGSLRLFEVADSILKRESGNYDVAILDFHAEATSEKLAMGYYLDGRASVVFGTHTHVATADEQVLPRGTGYITDIGMTGPDISILGVATDCIIKGFTTAMPQRYRVAEGKVTAHGALFTLSGDKCTKVERIVF